VVPGQLVQLPPVLVPLLVRLGQLPPELLILGFGVVVLGLVHFGTVGGGLKFELSVLHLAPEFAGLHVQLLLEAVALVDEVVAVPQHLVVGIILVIEDAGIAQVGLQQTVLILPRILGVLELPLQPLYLGLVMLLFEPVLGFVIAPFVPLMSRFYPQPRHDGDEGMRRESLRGRCWDGLPVDVRAARSCSSWDFSSSTRRDGS